MRLRLLIDVEWPEDTTALAEAIADQPVASVSVEGMATIGGRLMGATPVYETEAH
jgi:CO/xanthine dehydrogenase FAD-binding subunit